MGCDSASGASGWGDASAAVRSTFCSGFDSLLDTFVACSRFATMLRARRPCVNVPVLSVQAISTRPKASTADRRRTSASRVARRRATPVSPTLANSGRPSGAPASAIVAPVARREARGCPHRNPVAMTVAPPAAESGKNTRSIRASRTLRGLVSASSVDNAATVAPMRV